MSRLFDADVLLASLVDASLKGTVLLGVAFAAVLALRRASAAARHLVWGFALAAVTALPLASALLPTWRVPLPQSWTQGLSPTPSHATALAGLPTIAIAEARAESTASVPSVRPPVSDRPGVVLADKVQAAASPPAWPVSVWVLLVWLTGALASLAPMGLGLLSLWRLERSSRRVEGGPLEDALWVLAARFRLTRPVHLLQSATRAMPMTWGIARPVVLLPKGAEAWPSERLRIVLAHELAHVARWDCLTRLLAQLARALYWFNPLAWLAERCLRAEQERACDDLAMGIGVSASEYAEQLLAVTSSVEASRFARATAVALAMASGSGSASRLERRLVSILDPKRDRRPTTRWQAVVVTAVTLALVFPLASGRLSGAAREPRQDVEKKAEPAGGADAAAEDQAALVAKLREAFVRPLDDRKLTEGAVRGMVQALDDPYAEYFPPAQFAELQKQIQAKLSGIGAQLERKNERVIVVAPLAGSPAAKAGIRRGDVILEVDGKSTEGLAINEVVRRIVGREGTVVKLRVRHADGGEAELGITRASILVPTVFSARRGPEGRADFRLDPARQFGYVRLAQIGPDTAKDLGEAVKSLKAAGLKGMILDLRGCPGGLLDGVRAVAGLFIDKGPIVTIKSRGNAETTLEAVGASDWGDIPLVVLVNEQTASAAEILAGALKDRGRAVLVGTRTFGKGSVQTLISLQGGGAVRLTSAYFVSPNGRAIDKRAGSAVWGIDPTEGDYVPMTAQQTAALQKRWQDPKGALPPVEGDLAVTPERLANELGDPQLAAAFKALIARTTTGAFVQVGQPLPDFGAIALTPEVARQRREALVKDLEKLKKELHELNRVSPDKP